MATNVVGLFDDRDQAQRAVQDLLSGGFAQKDISLVAADPEGKMKRHSVDAEGNLAGEGAVSGATSGAITGGLFGLLVGAGVLAFPAIGLVAIGPLAGLLTGAGIGAVSGGIIGGLIGLGIPEEHAHAYAEGIRRGGTLVTVHANNDAEASRAADMLDRDGAVDIEERAETYRAAGFSKYDANAPVYTAEEQARERALYARPATTATTAAATPMNTMTTGATGTTASANVQPLTGNEDRLEVIKENITVGKREVERGGARIRTYVTERPVSEQVTLREEHVNVERRPVDRPASGADLQFREGTIEMRETAEVAVVAKEARVVEEVSIGKTADTRTETIRDTVREQNVEVESLAGGNMSNTGANMATGAFDDDYFRNDFQTRFASSGGNYEQYQPAYRYGFDLANHPNYAGKDYGSVRDHIRTEWEARNPGTFERFGNAIENAYNRARGAVGGGTGYAYADSPTPTGVPNNQPGIQTGGMNADGSADTRGITEKVADAVTGDRRDDKTGKPL